MPYIAPNTKVYILKGIPLDNSYEHTVAYPSADIQFSEFVKFKKFELEKLSYQRVGAGLMRVQLTYEQMYDCNYMMFQNTAYGNKWWYAFITGIAYVNNSVCEISYQIDVLQTWAYDYTFMESFVDREHVNPDTESFTNYKTYTQPEGLETGSEPFILQKLACGGAVDTVVLKATTTSTGNPQTGISTNYNNVSSLVIQAWHVGENFSDTAQTQQMKDMIISYVNNGFGDNIISIEGAPSEYQPTTFNMLSKYNSDGNFLGYKPKNPKIMCYPYHHYILSNREGSNMVIKPELIMHEYSNSSVQIKTHYYAVMSPLAVAYPVNYNNLHKDSGSDDVDTIDYSGVNNSVFISDYPTYSIANDSFKAWWAQNKNSYIATQGAIQRSYNTELANIGTSFAQADIQLRNSYANSMLSADVTGINSRSSENTTLQNATASNAYGALESGANAIGSLLSLDMGGVASGITGVGRSVVNQVAAQNTYSTNMSNINRTLGASQTIAGNNASAARSVAELAKQASSLSALTTSQNATASLVAKKQDMMNAPDSSIGSVSGSSFRTAENKYGFVLYEVCCKVEYLQMCDDYFEKYGYKIAQMKVPSKMNNRPYWHYLQTSGCNIKGDFNTTDITAIKTIYNNGVTTWNALENVGNYSLNNH